MPFTKPSLGFPRHTRNTKLALSTLSLSLLTLAALSCESVVESLDQGEPGSASPAHSLVTVSASVLEVGTAGTVSLQARDSEGTALTTGGLSVGFSISGGTSQGTFGATQDNGDGTYDATFTGTEAGSPTQVHATIDGEPVTSQLPTIQVVAPGQAASPDESMVTASPDVIEVGESGSVTLHARNAEGTELTTGGHTVGFTTSNGSSVLSFGPTLDNDDGTYVATFTGTAAGTPTDIGATIDGAPVTTELPTVQVVSAQPPPGGVVCEAIAPAECWYVAANAANGGNGSFESPYRQPQDAANQAGPGDFIYLRGGAEFTHAHASGGDLISVGGSCCADGQPGALITVKSYPGEQAVGRGEASGGIPTDNLDVEVRRSYWRIEGLRLIHGGIGLGINGSGLDLEHIWIVGNHLSDVRFNVGNSAVIGIRGQNTQGGPVDDSQDPEFIYVHNNVVRTTWGIQQDGSGPLPWHQDQDMEHHACLALFKSGGLVEIVGNDFSECPSVFYSKWLGPGPTVMRDNYFHRTRTISFHWRSNGLDVEGNVFANFTRDVAAFDLNQGIAVTTRIVNNTFDYTPWSMNSAGSRSPAVGWNSGTFRDNVFMGSQYWSGVPSGGVDIDGNCAIWTSDFTAAPGVSWQQYQSSGHDQNGVRVLENDPDAVFADPGSGDYTLIGQASSQCGGKGAGG